MPRSLTAVALLTALALALTAQPALALQQGVTELTLSFAFDRASTSADDQDVGTASELNLGVGVGRFVTDAVELEAQLSVVRSNQDPESGGNIMGTIYGIGGFVAYHFPGDGQVRPYVYAGAGFQIYDGDLFGEDLGYLVPAVGVGIRAMLAPRTSLNVGVAFQHLENVGGREPLSSNQIGLHAGFSVFFGGNLDD